MAGSISLAGAQQFDVLGRLLGGAKVHWIQAGTTSTPQNAYYDPGLSSPLPNPYTLGADARVPFHYLADGQIKVRIVDSNGVTRFEQDNILVIGPSSGGGGGGGVDPTTIFQTGDVLWMPIQGTRSGWVRANGRTLGSASSGATERANADTATLYAYLWNNFTNAICPVSTGRGASAAADFAANKTITLLDWRGYVPGGLDDMGNTAASRWANVPVVSGDAVTAGSVLGEATHALVAAEHASHDHDVYLYDQGHVHGPNASVTYIEVQSGTGSARLAPAGGGLTYQTSSATTGLQVRSATAGGGTQNKTNTQGSGTAHNTVQKTVLGTFYLKL